MWEMDFLLVLESSPYWVYLIHGILSCVHENNFERYAFKTCTILSEEANSSFTLCISLRSRQRGSALSTNMSNAVLKHRMDLVKVELDSDNESQSETSCTEAQQTDLKQEKLPAPFTFVAVREMDNMCKMEHKAHSERHAVSPAKLFVTKVEAHEESSNSTTGSEEIKEDITDERQVSVSSNSQTEEVFPGEGKDRNCNSEARQFKCDVCDMIFIQNQNLKRHYRTHTGEKPYKCNICNMLFSQSQNLKRHYVTHSLEKPYKCDSCEKLFSDSVKLKLHYRIHTGEKPYKCDVCNKEFSYSLNFNRHYRVHTGEKPYECKVCKRPFSQSRNLKVHVRIHTGERPYKCDLCSKRFNTRGNLKIHSRTHTGEKPFGCELCKKKFATFAHVKSHYRTHML